MAEVEGRQYSRGSEEVVEELRREFLDDIEENLRSLDVALDAARHGRKAMDELIVDIRRVALPLRGQAASFGVRLLGTVAHRLEDYLANARNHLSGHAVDDLQIFVDTLLDITVGKVGPDAEPAEIVRRLPAKPYSFDVRDIEVRNIEVMLVMLHSAQAHYVERELQQCGYRVTTCANAFEALPLVVRTKPDLIIISAMMPELSGIDLAVALSSMPATRNIPTALITSLDKDDEQLKFLPRRMPIIFKGPSFGDDLYRTLDSLFLI